MLKLLVFTSCEQRRRRGSGDGKSPPSTASPPQPSPACHLGVRQDDLRDAADDGDEVEDVPGVPEIILQEETEKEQGFEIGVASLKGAGTSPSPRRAHKRHAWIPSQAALASGCPARWWPQVAITLHINPWGHKAAVSSKGCKEKAARDLKEQLGT